MAKTTSPITSALGIMPAENPKEYYLVEYHIQNDKIIKADKSEPIPFHIAVYRQKLLAAQRWTGGIQ